MLIELGEVRAKGDLGTMVESVCFTAYYMHRMNNDSLTRETGRHVPIGVQRKWGTCPAALLSPSEACPAVVPWAVCYLLRIERLTKASMYYPSCGWPAMALRKTGIDFAASRTW